MTDKTYGLDGKKLPGWYSWRHKTSEANRIAREAYAFARGRDARIRRANERLNKAEDVS